MKKFFRKNKNWLIPVAAILAVGLFVGAIGGAFDNVGKDLKEKVVNDKNLLKYEDYKDVSGEYNGVDVKVLKDGSIKLDGTATKDVSIVLVQDLERAGIMTFAALDMGDEAESSYIEVLVDDSCHDWSSSLVRTCASNYVTFNVSDYEENDQCQKEIRIKLEIKSGDTFDDVTLCPVLTYGVVPQTFYSIG